MIGFPAPSAGATLWHTRLSGKLNGVMPSTGPRGNRRATPRRPLSPVSNRISSPVNRFASSPANVIVLIARSTSDAAYFHGLPPSRTIVVMSSSRRALMPAAASSRMRARSPAFCLRVRSNEDPAAVSASSISAHVHIGTSSIAPAPLTGQEVGPHGLPAYAVIPASAGSRRRRPRRTSRSAPLRAPRRR